MAETNPTPPPAPHRTPLWMRVLLVGSLGLNFLVFGMVAASILSGGGPGAPREAARDLAGSPFVRALGTEDRRAILRELRRERDTLRENRAALRVRFERLLATLRADDLDLAELERIVAEQRAAALDRLQIGERLVVGRIALMSLEERRAYADRLEEAVTRPRRR